MPLARLATSEDGLAFDRVVLQRAAETRAHWLSLLVWSLGTNAILGMVIGRTRAPVDDHLAFGGNKHSNGLQRVLLRGHHCQIGYLWRDL